MRMRSRVAVGVGVALCVAALGAQMTTKEAPGDIVATVGDKKIALAEVDELALKHTADQFGNLRLQQAVYAARRATIEDLVARRLLDDAASAEHIEPAKLLEREVLSKAATPTDAEITTWYLANQERVQGATLEQARSAIRKYLVEERTEAARVAYIERLKAKTPVKVLLEQPREVVKGDGPALGPANAPIELVEFSDFECPYCRRAAPIVKQVLDAYGPRVRFVYRNYPLAQHANARPAAEAAACADEQGKFWPYHDRLFGDPTRTSEAHLKLAASELQLDAARFNTCYDSRLFRGKVDADIKAGTAAGVMGTPAFFVNGRPLIGNPTLEEFKRLIDDELELKKVR
jgi:protein-disulfide isomerase